MRLVTRFALVALVALPVLGGVASAGGPPDPFQGGWESIDAFDGSTHHESTNTLTDSGPGDPSTGDPTVWHRPGA